MSYDVSEYPFIAGTISDEMKAEWERETGREWPRRISELPKITYQWSKVERSIFKHDLSGCEKGSRHLPNNKYDNRCSKCYMRIDDMPTKLSDGKILNPKRRKYHD